jgi:hypothetical protein
VKYRGHVEVCYPVRNHISTIFKAPVSTVIMYRPFTNKLSQIFQINPLHAYKWPNGGPAQARRPWAPALAQARHADLLTVLGRSISLSAHLIKSA